MNNGGNLQGDANEKGVGRWRAQGGYGHQQKRAWELPARENIGGGRKSVASRTD